MLTEQLQSTIRRYRLINPGDKILVAVSGGPDSVCLVYLLRALAKELKITLHMAHLDHMLRTDSAKDRKFVQELSAKLKIPLTCGRINVKELAKKGSLEEIARNARLGFLFKAAKEVRADKIALGHNLDDQAETVLMRILRGTGLYGLAAMLPKREILSFQVIRPLIEIRRSEIESYLRKRKIRPRIDSSNLKDVYFRNKIRHKLLPYLEKHYNRNIKEVLANMAQNIACDYDYLACAAQRAGRGVKTRINLTAFKRQHQALQRLILRRAIANLKGDTRRITFQHIKEIEDLVLNRPINSVVDLPSGISVIKRKYLSFYRKHKQ